MQDLESAVEKERCSSKMKPRLRAECVVLRGQYGVSVSVRKTLYCLAYFMVVQIIYYCVIQSAESSCYIYQHPTRAFKVLVTGTLD